MKNITATDLVPVRVFMGIAKRVREKAAQIAKGKNVPLKSANEIGILTPKVTQNQVAVELSLGKKLSAYEWGSGIHRKRGTPALYPILPRNAKALAFPGTNEFEGQTIITKVVMHPGVEARPFIEPAKRATRKQNLEDMRKANLEGMRLIIRSMARKV